MEDINVLSSDISRRDLKPLASNTSDQKEAIAVLFKGNETFSSAILRDRDCTAIKADAIFEDTISITVGDRDAISSSTAERDAVNSKSAYTQDTHIVTASSEPTSERSDTSKGERTNSHVNLDLDLHCTEDTSALCGSTNANLTVGLSQQGPSYAGWVDCLQQPATTLPSPKAPPASCSQRPRQEDLVRTMPVQQPAQLERVFPQESPLSTSQQPAERFFFLESSLLESQNQQWPGQRMVATDADVRLTVPDRRNIAARPESDELGRFVTTQSVAEEENLRPFYDGDYVRKRMTEVRRVISEIRRHWSTGYDKYLQCLRKLLPVSSKDRDVDDTFVLFLMEALFAERKDWKESKAEVAEDPFHIIKLYTSNEGYKTIFSVINRLFRKDDVLQMNDVIAAAVFLVELINIDLFNYCLLRPERRNFCGVVYRGMILPEKDFLKFKALLYKPIAERYISVPLGLMSSSLEKEKAEHFLSMGSSDSDRTYKLLCKIHIIEMKAEYLREFRKHFPECVVSSICAVDISDLSVFQHEKEVLLRGPFFQVLQLHKMSASAPFESSSKDISSKGGRRHQSQSRDSQNSQAYFAEQQKHREMMHCNSLTHDPQHGCKMYEPPSAVDAHCGEDSQTSGCVLQSRSLATDTDLIHSQQSSSASSCGSGAHVLEMVMLNTNRDHVTSVLMSEAREAAARRLFGTMVAVSRGQFCHDYCLQHGLHGDAEAYAALLSHNQALLESLLKEQH